MFLLSKIKTTICFGHLNFLHMVLHYKNNYEYNEHWMWSKFWEKKYLKWNESKNTTTSKTTTNRATRKEKHQAWVPQTESSKMLLKPDEWQADLHNLVLKWISYHPIETSKIIWTLYPQFQSKNILF